MDPYFLLLTVFGAVILLTAWLPLILKNLPLSLPMVCIGIGVLLVLSPFSSIVGVNPLENRYLTERLTEFVVIVSLMGAGLKLDRPIGWRNWGSVRRQGFWDNRRVELAEALAHQGFHFRRPLLDEASGVV